MDILLKNGKIYDGTGADAFLGDILVRGDRIEKIGEGLICDGAQVIDLQGLSVSSGFIYFCFMPYLSKTPVYS